MVKGLVCVLEGEAIEGKRGEVRGVRARHGSGACWMGGYFCDVEGRREG
jgi:hypothetical protein